MHILKNLHFFSKNHVFCNLILFIFAFLLQIYFFYRNKMDENVPEIVWKKRVEIELKKLTEEPKTKTDLLRK